MHPDPHYVEALKRERAMHLSAGHADRAAEVASELARATGKATETTALEPTENATRPRPARKRVQP